LFAAAAFAQEPKEECPPRFSYCGYSGPAQWPNLPIEKNECGGERQSPINLVARTRSRGGAITVAYKATNVTIQNTGHDIKVTPTEDAGEIEVDGKFYKLLYLHFHVPSEHHIPGVEALAEMHIVHQLKGGSDQAVIGVMLTRGATYPALAPVFANLPLDVCAAPKALLQIDFDKLLPKTVSGYFTYSGSLTTPPCTEKVTWYVIGAARPILASDLTKLSALGQNARPIQNNPKPLDVTYVLPK
jgi:carbonic anhydrase